MAKVVVKKAETKSEAENYAKGYRDALRRKGIDVRGRVKVVKAVGGYAAVDMGKKAK